MPTEAEWEYACRAEATTGRFFGTSEAVLPQYGWVAESHPLERTWPVGQLKPNDLGLFDVYGNAAEWCLDEQWRYPNPGADGAHEDVEQKALIRGRVAGVRLSLLRSHFPRGNFQQNCAFEGCQLAPFGLL